LKPRSFCSFSAEDTGGLGSQRWGSAQGLRPTREQHDTKGHRKNLLFGNAFRWVGFFARFHSWLAFGAKISALCKAMETRNNLTRSYLSSGPLGRQGQKAYFIE